MDFVEVSSPTCCALSKVRASDRHVGEDIDRQDQPLVSRLVDSNCTIAVSPSIKTCSIPDGSRGTPLLLVLLEC